MPRKNDHLYSGATCRGMIAVGVGVSEDGGLWGYVVVVDIIVRDLFCLLYGFSYISYIIYGDELVDSL